MEDMERHMGSMKGQVDIWKAWKNWWTFDRYQRRGGHMDYMEIWVNMCTLYIDRWTYGQHRGTGEHIDKMMI